MGKFRMGAIAAGLTLAGVMAAPAFAIGSKADCNYEGGEVFDVQGATVCLVQIRPEEYRDNEAYDGQQLGVNECNGEVINDGLFCKVTLVPAPPKPATSEPTTVNTPSVPIMDTDTSQGMVNEVIDDAADMANDEAEDVIDN